MLGLKYSKNTSIKNDVEQYAYFTNQIVEDIKKFGMIPEFLGRLPIVYTLDGLTEEMLVKVLKEPKNAILKQYQKLLSLDGIELEFEKPALEALARKAIELRTGARGLRAEMERFMTDIIQVRIIPKTEIIHIDINLFFLASLVIERIVSTASSFLRL